MEYLQILGIIFELLTTVAGFVSTYLILKRNPKYIGNRMMATSTTFIGLYTLFILFYDLVAEVWAVQVFLRAAMISILFVGVFIFYTIQILVFSSKNLMKKKNWVPFLVASLVYSVYLILEQNFITILSIDPVNVSINMLPLLILIAQLLFYVLFSIFFLVKNGIMQTTGQTKKKITIYTIGLSLTLIAIVLNIISQLVAADVGEILDVVYFAIICLSVSVMSIGFLLKQE
jgi:hypothetical protein